MPNSEQKGMTLNRWLMFMLTAVSCVHYMLACTLGLFFLVAIVSSDQVLKPFFHCTKYANVCHQKIFDTSFFVFVTCSTLIPARIKGIEKHSTIYTNNAE